MRFRALKAGRLAKGFRSEEVPIGFESKHALNNIKRMGTYYIIAQLHEFYNFQASMQARCMNT